MAKALCMLLVAPFLTSCGGYHWIGPEGGITQSVSAYSVTVKARTGSTFLHVMFRFMNNSSEPVLIENHNLRLIDRERIVVQPLDPQLVAAEVAESSPQYVPPQGEASGAHFLGYKLGLALGEAMFGEADSPHTSLEYYQGAFKPQIVAPNTGIESVVYFMKPDDSKYPLTFIMLLGKETLSFDLP